MNLSEEKVLVVGGTGRIGAATAQLAHKHGADVIVSSRSAPQALPEGIQHLKLDVTVDSEVVRVFSQLPHIDHVVVALAAQAKASSIDSTPANQAKLAFDRFWACYNILHFGVQHLQRNGSVTLISGSSSRRPVRGYGVWTALHGAIESLARAAAIDLAPLRINVVSPGGIEMEPDRQLAEHKGKAEDVAAMIVALCSNPAITNTVVDVDGGERLGNWPSYERVR